MDMFSGKKTYLVALAMVAYAFLGMVLGEIRPEVGGRVLLEAAALAGLRLGIKKAETPK